MLIPTFELPPPYFTINRISILSPHMILAMNKNIQCKSVTHIALVYVMRKKHVMRQDSLFHIAPVYPGAKWVPSINKAVLRACELYAANCSGISLGGMKCCPCVQAC